MTVDEIVKLVLIGLAILPLNNCPGADESCDGLITVDEILRAVDAALGGCPGFESADPLRS